MAKVDIIVPVRNGLADSVEMFESLKKNTSNYRLIVVDNGSTDGTYEYFSSRGVEVIRLEENLGFGAALNKGIERIEAENVVFLNNDVILTKGWLEKLLFYKEKFPAPVGLIGPVSNFAGGTQQVPFTERDPERQAAKIRREAPQRPLLEASFLSFFCVLLDARVIESVGKLEEWFPGGYEDNDYCNRAWEAGWKLLIARDVFVFHKGSRTLLREFGRGDKVFDSRLKYFYKYWQKAKNQKIVALYRVKNDHENFRRSLERTSKIVDAIYVWDDNSNPPLKKLISSFPKVEKYFESHYGFNEYRDRSALLSWAKASPYQWALALDSDEMLEKTLTYEKLHELVRVPDPLIRSFIFHENTFWFKDFFRMDGVWNSQAHDRLYKLNLNEELTQGTSKGFHCSTVPIFPPESRRITCYRIEHYGYLDEKRRKEKYQFYTKTDTEKDPRLIGAADYSHLLDNGFLRVCKFIPDNHFSLNILMREGEEKEAAQILSDLWGMSQEVNILAERRNDDLNLMEEIFNVNVYLDEKKMDLSSKRNFLLDKSSKRWVLFLDTDEKLENPGLLRPMMDAFPDGYLFYVKNLQKNGKITFSENVRFFRKETGLRFSGKVHETVETSVKENSKMVNSPCQLIHFGYLKDEKFLKKKLESYFELLQQELKANPDDPKIHFALALHYLNEGKEELAERYLKNAVRLNPKFAEASKELAHLYLKKAKDLFGGVVPSLSASHPLRGKLNEINSFLNKVVEERIRVGVPDESGN